MKACGRCKEVKDLSEYYPRGIIRTDPMSYCKSCVSEDGRIRNKKLKLDAFEHYGGCRCVCCGVTDEVFLALDHVDNDGAKHRKQIGTGNTFYGWLRRMNYPKDLNLQVLCHNCNIAKEIDGVCPHKVSVGV